MKVVLLLALWGLGAYAGVHISAEDRVDELGLLLIVCWVVLAAFSVWFIALRRTGPDPRSPDASE